MRRRGDERGGDGKPSTAETLRYWMHCNDEYVCHMFARIMDCVSLEHVALPRS